jgi:hypothetical protein
MLTHQYLLANYSNKTFKVRINSEFFRERQTMTDAWTIYIGGSYRPRPNTLEHLDYFYLDPSLESSDDFEFEIGFNETVLLIHMGNVDAVEIDESTMYTKELDYTDYGDLHCIAVYLEIPNLIKRYVKFDENPIFFVEEVIL